MIPSSTLLPSVLSPWTRTAPQLARPSKNAKVGFLVERSALLRVLAFRESRFSLSDSRERDSRSFSLHTVSHEEQTRLYDCVSSLSLSLFRSDDGTTLLDDTLARSIASAGTLTRLGDSTSDCGRTHESTRDSNDLAGARRGDSWSRAEPSPYEPFPSRWTVAAASRAHCRSDRSPCRNAFLLHRRLLFVPSSRQRPLQPFARSDTSLGSYIVLRTSWQAIEFEGSSVEFGADWRTWLWGKCFGSGDDNHWQCTCKSDFAAETAKGWFFFFGGEDSDNESEERRLKFLSIARAIVGRGRKYGVEYRGNVNDQRFSRYRVLFFIFELITRSLASEVDQIEEVSWFDFEFHVWIVVIFVSCSTHEGVV